MIYDGIQGHPGQRNVRGETGELACLSFSPSGGKPWEQQNTKSLSLEMDTIYFPELPMQCDFPIWGSLANNHVF